MKNLIGRIVRKKEQSPSISPSRFSRLYNNHEARRGYVPVLVGKFEEEEERFMVPLGWINHPCMVALLQLSANEFGYQYREGVIQIPCEPHHFRLLLENISSK